MTRVDFYILGSRGGDRQRLGCRIAEKAWRNGHRVLLVVDDAGEADQLDRLLWTFRDQSFVPHGHLSQADPRRNPVLITSGDEAGDEHDVLINLSCAVPRFFSRFERVAECVAATDESRELGRQRFRYYRDHGYPLTTHDLD